MLAWSFSFKLQPLYLFYFHLHWLTAITPWQKYVLFDGGLLKLKMYGTMDAHGGTGTEYLLAVTWTPLEAAQGRFHEKEENEDSNKGPNTWLIAAEYSEFTDLSCRLVQEAQATSVATLTPLGDACVLFMGCECFHCHGCCPDERELLEKRQVRITEWLKKLMETFVEHPGLLETCPSLDLFLALTERVKAIRTSYDSKT